MKQQKEIWRNISGYRGYYQINNKGIIKGISRTVNSSYGAKRTIPEKILTHHTSTHGYPYVVLCKNGICKKYSVHRLIALHFIPNPKNKPQVNHKNSNRLDYSINNLEWVTASENILHGFKYGFIKNNMTGRLGYDAPNSKTVLKFSIDGILLNEYGGTKEAQRETGIHQSNISYNCNGKRRSAGGFIWKYKDTP